METLRASQVAALLPDGATVAATGFTMAGVCEEIYRAIEVRFLESGHPRDLTFVHAAGHHDRQGHGLSHFAHEGLLRRIVGTHWALSPEMVDLIRRDDVEAYSFPHGVMLHLYRAIAQGESGFVTRVGIDTFIDPDLEGGRMNARARETGPDLVHAVELDGRRQLWFPAFPIEFGFVRATSSDIRGNLSTRDEALELEVLLLAQAVHNSGGSVIAQVRTIVEDNSIPAKMVAVPSFLVDGVLVAENPQETHRQTTSEYLNDALSGWQKTTHQRSAHSRTRKPSNLTPREIIGRRALLEVAEGDVMNIGVGIPGDTIGRLLVQEDLADSVELTVESGVINGLASGGNDFGVSLHPTAIVGHDHQFDFYDGGGLDLAFLGLGEVDCHGNVNVSRLPGRPLGVGGFINITQNAKRLVFMFTFTASGLRTRVDQGFLSILEEGQHPKFVKSVDQVSFAGARALTVGTEVLFVTERAAFRLAPSGIELTEVAPGIDPEHDILEKIPFEISVSDSLREYPGRLFLPESGFARDIDTPRMSKRSRKELKPDAS